MFVIVGFLTSPSCFLNQREVGHRHYLEHSVELFEKAGGLLVVL
jgi:hypothetical protein